MTQESTDRPDPHETTNPGDVDHPTGKNESPEQEGVGRIGSARRAFGRSFDRVTGTEYRRQFEEFSNVVSTTVLGVHRDQTELSRRVEELERANRELTLPSGSVEELERSNRGITPSETRYVQFLPFIVAAAAIALSLAALVRTL